MTGDEVLEKLEHLYAVTAAREAIAAPFDKRIAELEAERDRMCVEADAEIEAVKASIKLAVVAAGYTIKGTHFQCVYVKPRAKWDNRWLEGFAMAHPGVLEGRSFGPATVQFRKVK